MSLNNILKNSALIIVIMGGLLTSLRIDPYNIWAFNIGSLIYLIWAYRVKDMNFIALNSGMLVIYGIGLL